MSAFRTTRRAARAIALVYLLRLLVAWIVMSPIARALIGKQDVRERVQERAQSKAIARSLRQLYRARDRD